MASGGGFPGLSSAPVHAAPSRLAERLCRSKQARSFPSAAAVDDRPGNALKRLEQSHRVSELLREFQMEEHPQGGFHGLLEVIPTKADYVLDLIRANSLWPLLSGLSCCAIEMMSTATSVNDIDRFGMFPFRASPRQADVLIVAGTLTTKMAGPLVRLSCALTSHERPEQRPVIRQVSYAASSCDLTVS